MESSGIEHFSVYDGQNTFTKAEYVGNREKMMSNTKKNQSDNVVGEENYDDSEIHPNMSNNEGENKTTTVYIDGSCIDNGLLTAKGGYGVFFGDNHPWEFYHTS